jgi:uncharacterized protein (DUF1800 family)
MALSSVQKHLIHRATFAPNTQDIATFRSMSVQQITDYLFQQAGFTPVASNDTSSDLTSKTQNDLKKMSKEERQMRLQKERGLVFKTNSQWIHRMASSRESALLERITLFWHDHFACTTRFGKLATQQLNTLRQHGLGSFRDLVHAMAKDVSMIRFLNNQQNKKDQPNENFARELLELFTLGRGHYSEQDIKEAARAFTGWSSNMKGEFVFRPFQHDEGEKTFLGRRGNFNGNDIIDIVLEQQQTATFITRKILHYFLGQPAPEDKVQDYAQQYYASDYDTGKLLYTLFTSDWFYEAPFIGTKIKSPVELIAGLLRQLNGQVNNDMGLVITQRTLGQQLFNPPNVAGWPGGRQWINNATLVMRLNLIGLLFQAANIDFRVKDEARSGISQKRLRKLDAKVDLKPLEKWTRGQSPEETLASLADLFLPAAQTTSLAFLLPYCDTSSHQALVRTGTLALLSLPEYQLC